MLVFLRYFHEVHDIIGRHLYPCVQCGKSPAPCPALSNPMKLGCEECVGTVHVAKEVELVLPFAFLQSQILSECDVSVQRSTVLYSLLPTTLYR